MDGLLLLICGNVCTLLVLGLAWKLWELLGCYWGVVLYAVLFSEACWRPKQKLSELLSRLGSCKKRHGGLAALLVMLIAVACALLGARFLVALALDGQALFQEIIALVQSATEGAADKVDLNQVLTDSLDSINATVSEQRVACAGKPCELVWDWAAGIVHETALQESPLDHLKNVSDTFVSSLRGLSGAHLQQWSTDYWEQLKLILGSEEVTATATGMVWNGVKVFVGLGKMLKILMLYCVDIAFFGTLVWYILSAQHNILHEFAAGFMTCVDDDDDEGDAAEGSTESRIRDILQGVFFFPVILCVARLLCTLLVSLAVGLLLPLPHPYLVASCAFGITLVPIFCLYPSMVAFPWMVYLQVAHWGTGLYGLPGWLWGMAFMFLLYFCLGLVEEMAAKAAHKSIPAWVTGVSIVLGSEAWGLQAFIMGPLIVSIAALAYDIFKTSYGEAGLSSRSLATPPVSPVASTAAPSCEKNETQDTLPPSWGRRETETDARSEGSDSSGPLPLIKTKSSSRLGPRSTVSFAAGAQIRNVLAMSFPTSNPSSARGPASGHLAQPEGPLSARARAQTLAGPPRRIRRTSSEHVSPG